MGQSSLENAASESEDVRAAISAGIGGLNRPRWCSNAAVEGNQPRKETLEEARALKYASSQACMGSDVLGTPEELDEVADVVDGAGAWFGSGAVAGVVAEPGAGAEAGMAVAAAVEVVTALGAVAVRGGTGVLGSIGTDGNPAVRGHVTWGHDNREDRKSQRG